jgi:hypothetical protein
MIGAIITAHNNATVAEDSECAADIAATTAARRCIKNPATAATDEVVSRCGLTWPRVDRRSV